MNHMDFSVLHHVAILLVTNKTKWIKKNINFHTQFGGRSVIIVGIFLRFSTAKVVAGTHPCRVIQWGFILFSLQLLHNQFLSPNAVTHHIPNSVIHLQLSYSPRQVFQDPQRQQFWRSQTSYLLSPEICFQSAHQSSEVDLGSPAS